MKIRDMGLVPYLKKEATWVRRENGVCLGLYDLEMVMVKGKMRVDTCFCFQPILYYIIY